MKKIILILSLISLTVATTSCERDITSLNEDPKHPSIVPSGLLVASAEQALISQMLTPNVNNNISRFFTQQWAQTTYVDESNYDMVTRPIPRSHYNVMMASRSATVHSAGVLSALRDAKQFLQNEGGSAVKKKNNIAIIELISVYTWANLVDTYGDVPYFGTLKAVPGSPGASEIPYDDAKTIYLDLIKRIDAAVAMISTAESGYADDLFYKGNMSKWKKMGNSLKFKLAVTLSDADPAFAKNTAEAAYAAGLFESKDDNFGLAAFPSGLFANPVYQEDVQSGRNDLVPSEVLINYMNSTSDPRRARWFVKADRVFDKITGKYKPNTGAYKGGVYGKGNSFVNYSHMTSPKIDINGVPDMGDDNDYMLFTENAQGYLLDYSEISFLRAEAAARGFSVGGTGAGLYGEAITASMTEYGIAPASAATFIAANPYDASNWRKSIGFQAWVAMFNKGFQAWNFARRLNYPVFENPEDSTVESVPVRMKYSDQEYLLNKANVEKAASKIGGDKVSTKVFWDVN
ncbi:SusD/RagB family nutrient-binding outer membrane lipoprotein [Chryseobacterium sp. S0630]|uniref:SusD/RagB family nutrient-binding outer membrane lipoprotein n=1 Tax=Chryseobacterium sp. S0630 TaxID=2957803 RepID=UPI000555201A|nr:SusD/RagB family nutrient-binding outer membrane lipoprotein [Chryseobacterium sp. S0630]MCP1301018.1 SusD/RagB family nutrient-binding outer membrane lipoprotein [Chryseobacterium sp. S0630]